jgi:hypothetical protein
MIELNPENVRFIIQKAREFQTDEGEGFEEPQGDLDDLAALERSDETEDRTQDELIATIEDLEPDQQICLVALMWLGRGDYELEEWDAALEDARAAFNARTAQYLIGTPLLADYLEEGLQLHGYEPE